MSSRPTWPCVRGAPRVRSYLVAVVTAGLLCAVIDWTIKGTLDAAGTAEFRWWWKPVDALWIFLTVLFLGGLATFVYADWQAQPRIGGSTACRRAATHAGRPRRPADRGCRRCRRASNRSSCSTRLTASARSTTAIPRKGEQTIDDLIVYLRTAMPQMHESASTRRRAKSSWFAPTLRDRHRAQRRPGAPEPSKRTTTGPETAVSADAAVAAGRARDRERVA